MLQQFKPRKSKHGFRVTVCLETLRLCANMQELVKMYGGEEGVGKDYWLDLQNEMSTSNSTLVFYINGEAAYEALLPYSKA
jgi:hypothetical protein